jgi:hypothetical protein
VPIACPPKAPSNLSADLIGFGFNKRVILTWTDNSGNETGFIIEKAANEAGPWATLVTLPPNSVSYAERIGNTNNAYYYRVFARNTVGDTATPGFPTMTVDSDYSNIVQIGQVQVEPPAAPTNLNAMLQAGPQALLTWRDNANNETGFVVERSVNGELYMPLVTVDPRNGTGNVYFTDTTVIPGNSYTYRISAINAAGLSAYSNTASVSLPTLPAVPSHVIATATRVGLSRYGRITLTWDDNTANETGYRIQRATNETFTANLTTNTVRANITTFRTGILPRHTPYYLRIQAFNDVGQSDWVNANPLPIVTP